jgi:hypothetical protein
MPLYRGKLLAGDREDAPQLSIAYARDGAVINSKKPLSV